jgi:exosome complex RNA-binding protein Rrp42 (RNase PH superfamily)
MLDGFKQNVRCDGRTNTDCRPFNIHYGTVPEAFGSCTLTFGQEDTQVVCAIKAEIMKPLASEPNKG